MKYINPKMLATTLLALVIFAVVSKWLFKNEIYATGDDSAEMKSTFNPSWGKTMKMYG